MPYIHKPNTQEKLKYPRTGKGDDLNLTITPLDRRLVMLFHGKDNLREFLELMRG